MPRIQPPPRFPSNCVIAAFTAGYIIVTIIFYFSASALNRFLDVDATAAKAIMNISLVLNIVVGMWLWSFVKKKIAQNPSKKTAP